MTYLVMIDPPDYGYPIAVFEGTREECEQFVDVSRAADDYPESHMWIEQEMYA